MFPFGKIKHEARPSALEALRRSNYSLAFLPDTIHVSVMPGYSAIEKPITQATLDDIAFAMRDLEAEFHALGDQVSALRKLSQIVRDAGGLGADRAVDVAARAMQER